MGLGGLLAKPKLPMPSAKSAMALAAFAAATTVFDRFNVREVVGARFAVARFAARLPAERPRRTEAEAAAGEAAAGDGLEGRDGAMVDRKLALKLTCCGGAVIWP